MELDIRTATARYDIYDDYISNNISCKRLKDAAIYVPAGTALTVKGCYTNDKYAGILKNLIIKKID